ncbi:PREDICTED: uncharacterized protein LOC109176669 [Ipomoea nil]|uniref:uncharacterized protein LOC109176669 n=1 Tax=Ipomoea nil TaxID=35883 RepID=UPI000901DDF4|nr:PREDICTED: uncharacterized protein LOC109176669 [Ipomoea nil]
MHDVLRELALREAQKENLLCLKNDDSIISVGFRRSQLINSSRISHPWSIQSKIFSTFSFLDLSNNGNSKQFNCHLKFLRGLILDAQGYRAYSFISLVHLRWLMYDFALKLNSLPLFMLWNLQKLDVGDRSLYETLNISGLPQLKNLNVGGGITLVPPRSVHHNLESIRYLNYMSCTEELFMRIPNLRTLGVHLKRKAFNWFQNLAYLYKLEDLQVHGELLHPKFSTIHSTGTLSIENFLPNLKKLKLFETELNWKDMNVVGMLPKLEVLILEDNAAVGKKWKPKDGGFHGLKLLIIGTCDLQIWKATGDHFHVLECLVLKRLEGLKKIPRTLHI